MSNYRMIIGAIAGDMIGTLYNGKKSDAPVSPLLTGKAGFTGDSVMTIAVMDALLNGRDYISVMQDYGRKYPDRNYGTVFSRWLRQDYPQPFNSWSNGAALRISPVGFACRTLPEVLDEAQKNARISHSHPDGIKGAMAVAASVFLARNGRTKEEIRDYIESVFRYNLQKSIGKIRPDYIYDYSCQGSVPEAIICFLESTDYESAIGLAVSLGGNCSDLACITGGIAQAYYKEIPGSITEETVSMLAPDMYEIVSGFSKTYPLSLFY